MSHTERVSFEFNAKQKRSLEAMAEALDVSQAEVIRRAMALLNLAIRELKLGNQLAFVDSEERLVKLIVGIIDEVAT